MGYNRVRANSPLTAWQRVAAELSFAGMSDDEICHEIFPDTKSDAEKLKMRKKNLQKLMRSEAFAVYYQDLVSEWSAHNVGKALRTISDNMNDRSAWMRNTAANDVLRISQKWLTGTDENTVVLRVEGMPELGTPDGDQ